MINFDNLDTVETVNSRINYDLRFSQATGKFTLSDEAYREYDVNNNGFLLQKDGDTPVLKVIESKLANIHRGRSNADRKGKTFTADALADMLDLEKGKEDAKFRFEKTVHDGDTYLTLDRMGESSEEPSITDTDDPVDTGEDVEEPVVAGVNEGSGAMEEDDDDDGMGW